MVNRPGTSICQRPDGAPSRMCGRTVSAPPLNALATDGPQGSRHLPRIEVGADDPRGRAVVNGQRACLPSHRQLLDVGYDVFSEEEKILPRSLSGGQVPSRYLSHSIHVAAQYPGCVIDRKDVAIDTHLTCNACTASTSCSGNCRSAQMWPTSIVKVGTPSIHRLARVHRFRLQPVATSRGRHVNSRYVA